jgi:hypothetical protein
MSLGKKKQPGSLFRTERRTIQENAYHKEADHAAPGHV